MRIYAICQHNKKPHPLNYKIRYPLKVFTIAIYFFLSAVGLLAQSDNNAAELIFQKRVGTSLGKVSLYADSSYSNRTNNSYDQGELFEIIGESFFEHEDDAQNQKFKWFEVASMDGQTGWIFGDGIAVIEKEEKLSTYKSFHKQKMKFSTGFENAVTWIGSIEGRDNFHEQDYLNPAYKETYLIVTNERGLSAFINISGESAMGKTSIQQLKWMDLTNDGSPELLLETSSFTSGNNFPTRSFQIHAVQAGTIVEILNEILTVEYSDQIPAPSLSKFIEVSDQTIRVAYVDYISCEQFSLTDDIISLSKTMERCVEYVTYTYAWNKRRNNFTFIYPESRDFIVGGCKFPTVSMYQEPSTSSKRLSAINPYMQLNLIKHYETIDTNSGSKRSVPFFMVETDEGKKGFVRAADVGIIDIEHADLLNKYYSNPPLSKTDWKSDISFVTILSE